MKNKQLYLIILTILCATFYNYQLIENFENNIITKINNITQETILESNIYRMENKVNFQIRQFRKCSDNAKLKVTSGLSNFPYDWSNGYHYVDNINFSDVEIGDIITYKINNSLIRHPVINIYKNVSREYLISQGYNNNKPDKYYVEPHMVMWVDCFMINN